MDGDYVLGLDAPVVKVTAGYITVKPIEGPSV